MSIWVLGLGVFLYGALNAFLSQMIRQGSNASAIVFPLLAGLSGVGWAYYARHSTVSLVSASVVWDVCFSAAYFVVMFCFGESLTNRQLLGFFCGALCVWLLSFER